MVIKIWCTWLTPCIYKIYPSLLFSHRGTHLLVYDIQCILHHLLSYWNHHTQCILHDLLCYCNPTRWQSVFVFKIYFLFPFYVHTWKHIWCCISLEQDMKERLQTLFTIFLQTLLYMWWVHTDLRSLQMQCFLSLIKIKHKGRRNKNKIRIRMETILIHVVNMLVLGHYSSCPQKCRHTLSYIFTSHKLTPSVTHDQKIWVNA